jgi:WD40 repeat protein
MSENNDQRRPADHLRARDAAGGAPRAQRQDNGATPAARQRHCETANGLAADLKRHLNNELLVARPPSTLPLDAACIALTFSEDERSLATFTTRPSAAITVWSIPDGQKLGTFSMDDLSNVTGQSPDGNVIGSRNGQNTLRLWRVPSWEEIAAAEAKEKTESQKP